METYKPCKGLSLIYIVSLTVIWNITMSIIMSVVNSYTVLSLLKVAVWAVNVYFLYFISLSLSTRYIFENRHICIKTLWGLRKIRIPFESIEGYKVCCGNIRGIKLSGIGNAKFAFGRNIVDKIGTTHMFVTSSKSTVYIKTPSIVYAVSPEDLKGFENRLQDIGVSNHIGDYRFIRNGDLYKQKQFFIPFIIVTVVIIILTLNPLILYLKSMLPGEMPLSFDASFVPIRYGTGKQFAFIQMTYGVLNMVVLLCMYYASYFCAKYDRKSAYRYIYIAMITAVTFLLTQIRILITFG
jgi:hypothetical protein